MDTIDSNSEWPITDEALIRHSFDLVHFPLYLQRNVAKRVTIVIAGESEGADVAGFFDGNETALTIRYASFGPNSNGTVVNGGGFLQYVHQSFQKEESAYLQYVGFTRCGPPAYSPLVGLAALYRKYGRGIYLCGLTTPVPFNFTFPEFTP